MFGDDGNRFHVVNVPPLSRRRADVLALLEQVMSDSGGAVLFTQLSRPVLQALQAHDWPRNFNSLRLAARNIIALAVAGGVNSAADMLKVAPSTLSGWLRRLRLSARWFM